MSKALPAYPPSFNLVFHTVRPQARSLDNSLGALCRTKATDASVAGRRTRAFGRLGHSGSEDVSFDESTSTSGRGEPGEEKDTGGLAQDSGGGVGVGELQGKALKLGVFNAALRYKNCQLDAGYLI